MSCAKWCEFYPLLRVNLPMSIPDELLDQQLMLTSRDFFKETRAFRRTIQLALEPGVNEYKLEIGAGEDMPWRIEHLTYCGVPLRMVDQNQVHAWFDDPTETATAPTVYYQPANDKVFIAPTVSTVPRAPASYTQVYLSLIPKMSACGIPQNLFDEFHEIITYGTLANILKMPGKMWTDLETAAVFSAPYIQQRYYVEHEIRGGRVRPMRTTGYGGI